jgi:hypothetical protein
MYATYIRSKLHRVGASEKKSVKARRKKSAKKAKAPSAKEKSVNSRFFLSPQWKSGFRAQSRSAGGKARVLSEMYSSVCKETDGKRQRGTDTRKRHRRET